MPKGIIKDPGLLYTENDDPDLTIHFSIGKVKCTDREGDGDLVDGNEYGCAILIAVTMDKPVRFKHKKILGEHVCVVYAPYP